MSMPDVDVVIAGTKIPLGSRRRLELPVSRLATETAMTLPIEVINGWQNGPIIWLSAAIHGDELNGIEIIRRVVETLNPHNLRGTLISVPIVNVFGFIHKERYLPDRRDLNRSFPGTPHGSMASRLAHLMMKEVIVRCSYGIDLHTGSYMRSNIPQVRGNLKDAETRKCAEVFAAPMMVHANHRDGSLRQAASKKGITTLLFEGGEPLRFDEDTIECARDGILRVMQHLNMIEHAPPTSAPSLEIVRSRWVRAKQGGIFRADVKLGERVKRSQRLGVISNAFGEMRGWVLNPNEGIVIGATTCPYVQEGEAIMHIGETK